MLPERIGPYQILGLIGESGMGRVDRAQQAKPARQIALKVAGLQTRAVIERFQREVEMLARLEHPGIARLYASGLDAASGQPWLAMELVEGEELGDWARRVSPDRDASLGVLQSIYAANAFAHDRGILHRDLKPANVFIDARRAARVLDFGIARVLDTAKGADSTQTGRTASWHPPLHGPGAAARRAARRALECLCARRDRL
jgi:serine/threonine protein kinase